MIEFSLSINLGKKKRVDPASDAGMTVDRAFVARSLVAVAEEIQVNREIDGAIVDETGLKVGAWKLALLFED